MDNNYLDNEELHRLKVTELKDYLRQHSQPVSGKKYELIERAKGIKLAQLKNVNYLNLVDSVEDCIRKEEKNITPLGEEIPDVSELTGWTKDLNNLPQFCENDIYNYFVLKMNTKRQLRSKVYYDDGHVHNIEYDKVTEECSHCVVRAKVIPSLPSANKIKNPDHNTWIILSKETGNVHSANCDCTAGKGESCNHIAALMYAMSDINTKKKEGKLASTSVKQKWHVPRKRKISPKKAQDLNYRKYSLNDNSESDAKISLFKSPNEKKSKHVQDNFTCTVDVEQLAKKFKETKSQIGWLTFFEEPKNDEVPSLLNINYQYHDNVDLNSSQIKSELETIFHSITISDEQCQTIEKMTKGQGKNLLWYDARRERITSSHFGNVCKRSEDKVPDNLLKDLLGYRTFQSEYTNWGIKHEPAARRQYMNRYNVEVRECGLLVNPDFPFLGSSPDGLIGNDGLIEIKCPGKLSWRNITPQECSKDTQFYCYLDGDNICLKKSHNYYYQIQGQLALSSRQWCDFVVWTLKGLAVQRIYFDEQFWQDMQCKLEKFYLSAVLPELFTSRIKRGLRLTDLASRSDHL